MKFYQFARTSGTLRHSLCVALAASMVAFVAAPGIAGDINSVGAGQSGGDPVVSQAPAEPERQVFAGTIGDDAIVLELSRQETELAGRYFYGKSRFSIRFTGALTAEGMVLKGQYGETLALLRKTQTGLTGWVETPDRTQKPVNLPLIPEDMLSAGLLAENMPGLSSYERQQLSGLALEPGAVIRKGKHKLRVWHEPLSDMAVVRIERGYPAPILEKINAALTRRHVQLVLARFNCERKTYESCTIRAEVAASYLGNKFASFAQTEEAVRFLDPRLHNNVRFFNRKEGLTFDARTGDEMQLEDLLYFGEGPVPKIGTAEWLDYRSGIFPSRIAALFRQLHPKTFTGTKDCDHPFVSDVDWNSSYWYLTNKGLVLVPDAQTACKKPEKFNTIPWAHKALRRPVSVPMAGSDPDAGALTFGKAAFTRNDITSLALNFDDNGFPVLDIVLQPHAAKNLEAETIRSLHTDVPLAIGSTVLATPRVVEPITAGTLRLSGGLGFGEVQAKAWNIICTMRLTTSQFDPANLAGGLPCKPRKK